MSGVPLATSCARSIVLCTPSNSASPDASVSLAFFFGLPSPAAAEAGAVGAGIWAAEAAGRSEAAEAVRSA